jgi:hypothetical protein
VTTDPTPPRFEDRLLDALEQHLAQRPADARPELAVRRLPARRFAFVASAAALAAVTLVLVTTLGGSRPQVAQAAVLTRAVAALDQPGTITHLQVQDYSATGLGPCFLGLAAPLPCIGAGSAANTQTGISADPAEDTLTYSSQEWISADGGQSHTIYNNGDELATNATDDGYEAFDAADDTLTTLTGVSVGGGSAGPTESSADPAGAGSPLGVATSLSDPGYYEQLYQEALAGGQTTDGGTTITSQLVGQTTLAGEPVYELQFTVHFNPPADPPVGDLCGTSACTPPDQQIQLYLDAQTYLPVRSVMSIDNTRDLPGVPAGDAVWEVADFSVQSLPDTPANEALLAMSSHSGATTATETREQWVSSLEASSPSAARLARKGRTRHGAV